MPRANSPPIALQGAAMSGIRAGSRGPEEESPLRIFLAPEHALLGSSLLLDEDLHGQTLGLESRRHTGMVSVESEVERHATRQSGLPRGGCCGRGSEHALHITLPMFRRGYAVHLFGFGRRLCAPDGNLPAPGMLQGFATVAKPCGVTQWVHRGATPPKETLSNPGGE